MDITTEIISQPDNFSITKLVNIKEVSLKIYRPIKYIVSFLGFLLTTPIYMDEEAQQYALHGVHTVDVINKAMTHLINKTIRCPECYTYKTVLFTIRFQIPIQLYCDNCLLGIYLNRDEPFCSVIYQYWSMDSNVPTEFTHCTTTVDDHIKYKQDPDLEGNEHSMYILNTNTSDPDLFYLRYLHLNFGELLLLAKRFIRRTHFNNTLTDIHVQKYVTTELCRLNIHKYVGRVAVDILLRTNFVENLTRYEDFFRLIAAQAPIYQYSILDGIAMLLVPDESLQTQIPTWISLLVTKNIIVAENLVKWYRLPQKFTESFVLYSMRKFFKDTIYNGYEGKPLTNIPTVKLISCDLNELPDNISNETIPPTLPTIHKNDDD